MSDQVGNQNVAFLMTRLNCTFKLGAWSVVRHHMFSQAKFPVSTCHLKISSSFWSIYSPSWTPTTTMSGRIPENRMTGSQHQGPVVQSIISITGVLRGQLFKCMWTRLFFVFFLEKCENAKDFHIFFNKK